MANVNAEANQDQESAICENDVIFRKYMENDTTITRINTLVISGDESNTYFQRETAEFLNSRYVLFTLQSSVNITNLVICFQKLGKSWANIGKQGRIIRTCSIARFQWSGKRMY